ncbi:CMP-N-acetylneuraminate-beta-galactosamide-alpha-2,3-sialyltransferase 2-like isoform X3 [Chroicocephalus ridibundus]|uniref:CMP-N-acetylneuraminate-beta-galactosamide- alpha-2,3-sialyltransferase 2-like isoform X3 n=1 Tax=Chroicocephalus ridibundus TaxID=1192867 RepID=UPI002FDE00B0
MLCQRHVQVVLALCLLLVLWQCLRAPTDGLSPFPWAPSLLVSPAARCTASANSSTWFNTRYDMAVGPLLTGTAHELSSDVVQWWLTLQGPRNGIQLQAIIQQLFSVLPAPTGSVRDPSRCRTCAVVGNSGRLTGSGHGLRIDAHDWVLSTYARVKQFIKADRNKVLILSPAFLKYIHENWTQRRGRYPSTGFTALLFALHACQQVSVFGFGADSEGNWHHYWEKNRWSGAFRRTRVHDADVEFSLIERLAAEGRISFYK